MRDSADERGNQAIYLDVSDAGDEAAFVQRLYSAVLETDLGEGLWSRLKKVGSAKPLNASRKSAAPP